MRIEFGLNHKIIFHVTDEERIELDKLKNTFSGILDEYMQEERENLDIEFSQFVLNKYIVEKLYAKRTYIIKTLAYDTTFEDLFEIQGVQKFKNDEDFLVFANAYNILEDTYEGLKVLKNIASVKIIDWLIHNWYNKKESLVTNKKAESYNTKIFRNSDSERFINYLIEEIVENRSNPIKPISYIFRKFWIREDGSYSTYSGRKYGIICKKMDFENYCTQVLNLNIKKGDINTLDEIAESTQSNLDEQIQGLLKLFESRY